MVKFKLLSLLSISILLLIASLNAAVRKDIQSIIDKYNSGDLVTADAIIKSIQPESAEERAIILYYQALLTTDADAAQITLQQLIETYPREPYTQKAMYELGSLQLLNREYDNALSTFNKITNPDFSEKHFWIANTYFQKGDYTNSIASANQFIRLVKSSHKLEDAHYLIADSYINLSQYSNAITSLKKLLTQPKLIEDEQYLRYRYGYASEMLGNRAEALSQYKQGYELDRYSQLAYLIEDNLFEMRSKYGSVIDLSFLYPHVESPLPDIVLSSISPPDTTNGNIKPDTTFVNKTPQLIEIDTFLKQGLYLQAGRFGNQANALKLCEKIIKLNLNAQYYQSKQFQDISWVVIVGPYETQLDAVSAKTTLRLNEIDSFIIQR